MSWHEQRPDDSTGGAFMAEAPVSFATVEPKQFREAMARLGAAVHVVTTDGPGGKHGFTATAVSSVSDQPATLLVCLNRRSRIIPVLHDNGILCINTLRAGDDSIADVFAGRTGLTGAQRFLQGQWRTLVTGAPVLESAVVSCDCRIIESKPVASHNVYFCGVVGVRQGESGRALVYHDREYKHV
jgi:flavin reductase (DIM6/NTAB) family NADH-FMN oxidoreductase RutF